MGQILEGSLSVFFGLCLFLILLWFIAAIIWFIYGKRYFAPDKESRKTAIEEFYTDEDSCKEEECEDEEMALIINKMKK